MFNSKPVAVVNVEMFVGDFLRRTGENDFNRIVDMQEVDGEVVAVLENGLFAGVDDVAEIRLESEVIR